MKSINTIDLFCGAGGLSHGFEMEDDRFNVVCAIDRIAAATKTVELNKPKCTTITDDIRKIHPQCVADKVGCNEIDLIVGGPPCQGFSSLRPFRSSDKEDLRNTLFEQFALFVHYFRPKVIVMENVVGLVTHKNGNTLDEVQKCFSRLGYKSEWMILNAAHYGVPQKRERFVLIGTSESGPILFPKPTHHYSGNGIGHRNKNKMVASDHSLPNAVTVAEAIDDLPIIHSGQHADSYQDLPNNSYQEERRKRTKVLTLHVASNHSDKMLEIIKYSGDNIKCIPKHLITSGFSSCYSRLNPNEPSTTITVKFRSPSSNKCIHPFLDRSITPREAARIQSFDDDFKFHGSLTDISTMLGNAVPPLLGRAIARSVLSIIDNKRNNYLYAPEKKDICP